MIGSEVFLLTGPSSFAMILVIFFFTLMFIFKKEYNEWVISSLISFVLSLLIFPAVSVDIFGVLALSEQLLLVYLTFTAFMLCFTVLFAPLHYFFKQLGEYMKDKDVSRWLFMLVFLMFFSFVVLFLSTVDTVTSQFFWLYYTVLWLITSVINIIALTDLFREHFKK